MPCLQPKSLYPGLRAPTPRWPHIARAAAFSTHTQFISKASTRDAHTPVGTANERPAEPLVYSFAISSNTANSSTGAAAAGFFWAGWSRDVRNVPIRIQWSRLTQYLGCGDGCRGKGVRQISQDIDYRPHSAGSTQRARTRIANLRLQRGSQRATSSAVSRPCVSRTARYTNKRAPWRRQRRRPWGAARA